MNRLVVLGAILLLAGCSAPNSETTSEDSAVAAVIDSIPTLTDEQYQQQEIQLSRKERRDIRSAFDAPQLNPRVAYVHRPQGLHLYASQDVAGDTTRSTAILPYGAKVSLQEALVNSRPEDTQSFEGFRGRFIRVTTDQGTGFIFSGYLSTFPLASSSQSIVEYFLTNFHLAAPVDQQRSDDSTDIYVASQYNDVYSFEAGIHIEDHGYYEGSGTDVTLPEWFTLQEAFLLTRSFSYLEVFSKAFRKYPDGAEERTIEEGVTTLVEMDADGSPKTIKIIDQTGCYDETFVAIINGKVMMSTGGGC